MSDRGAAIHLVRCEVEHVSASRRSSRTHQTHPLGGFIGSAQYEGALSEFLPYLEAVGYTGVGRQTVWGKGEVAVQLL